MLPRKNRLRDREAIEALFQEKPIQTRLFVVYKKKSTPPPQLLVVAGAKKIKRSTRRNRFRRRLHEAFREILPTIPTTLKVIVLARPEAAEADYGEIKDQLAHALAQ